MAKKFRFVFESFFETKGELREEIEKLLWQMDHTWPLGIYPQKIDWIKDNVNKSFVKTNGGAQRQNIVLESNIHNHLKDCECCRVEENQKKGI